MPKKIEPRMHPAPFSSEILVEIERIVDEEAGYQQKNKLRVLDPFAGEGWIHELAHNTVGIELEPEWAMRHEGTEIGDATDLPFRANSFDVIATSPCYGNRMADHHDNKDVCKNCHNKRRLRVGCKICKGTGLSHRRTYTHYLGRKLSTNNAGSMQWGDEYRELHEKAWDEACRVLRFDGLFILNIRNHYRTMRKGEGPILQRVAEWHLETLGQRGLAIQRYHFVDTPGYRFGENRELRLDGEQVIVMRKLW